MLLCALDGDVVESEDEDDVGVVGDAFGVGTFVVVVAVVVVVVDTDVVWGGIGVAVFPPGLYSHAASEIGLVESTLQIKYT